MSLTIADFYSRVSRAIKRGTTYDLDIPIYARDAMETLEGKHQWQHSRVLVENQNLPAGETDIDLGVEIKAVRFVRLRADVQQSAAEQQFFYFGKVLLEDLPGILQARRATQFAYAMLNLQTIRLSVAFDKDQSLDILYYATPAMDDNLPWITKGENILVAQTITEMAPLLRDDKLIRRWQTILDVKLPEMIESDLDHKWDAEGGSMVPFSDSFVVETQRGIDPTGQGF